VLEHLDKVFCIFLVLMLFLWITEKWRLRRSARSIQETLKKTYAARQERGLVNAADFPDLDLDFYEQGRRDLEQMGFTYLGDIENVTAKEAHPECKTFMRTMLGRGGTVAACLYHPKFRIWMRLLLWVVRMRVGRVVDLETEFSDGCFLCTSNAELAAKMSDPPQIRTHYVKAGTPIHVILEAHDRGVREYLEKEPELEPLAFHSLEEVLESSRREDAIRAAFRESVGWVTKEDLERCGGKDKSVAHEVYEEVQRMRVDEVGSETGSGPTEDGLGVASGLSGEERRALRIRGWGARAAILGLLVGFGEVVAHWIPLQPFGSMSFLHLAALLFFMAVLLLPLMPFFWLLKRFSRTKLVGAVGLTFSISVFGSTFVGNQVGHHVRMREFRQLGQRSGPLVQAIRQYEVAEGSLPESLAELVPAYLPKVPLTGMGAYPEYSYSRAEEGDDFYGNTWMLSVPTPMGLINWDSFIYLPNGDYPRYGFGGSLERIGEWAYVHE
jgi:hypothetical protein